MVLSLKVPSLRFKKAVAYGCEIRYIWARVIGHYMTYKPGEFKRSLNNRS